VVVETQELKQQHWRLQHSKGAVAVMAWSATKGLTNFPQRMMLLGVIGVLGASEALGRSNTYTVPPRPLPEAKGPATVATDTRTGRIS
jgi:hypothetical protein